MADFLKAYNKTEKLEGTYSNNPKDRGGETVNGISRNRWPSWFGWYRVDKLKKESGNLVTLIQEDTTLYEDTLSFYRKNFWDYLKLNKLPDQEIANELFDTAVNQGKVVAAKYFQEALNLLNNNEKLFSNLKIDGLIGPKTLAAYNSYKSTSQWPSRSVSEVQRTFLKVLNGLQIMKYIEIVRRDESQEVFLYGWLRTRID